MCLSLSVPLQVGLCCEHSYIGLISFTVFISLCLYMFNLHMLNCVLKWLSGIFLVVAYESFACSVTSMIGIDSLFSPLLTVLVDVGQSLF